MREYIDREAAIKALCFWCAGDVNLDDSKPCSCLGKKEILDTPAADVAEVKHGAWKLESEIHKMLDDVDEEFYVKCPFCNRTEWVGFDFEPEKMLEWARKEYPYCHCGAKMDGKAGDV